MFVEFILKKVSEDSPHYNLTFMKEVHKRNGEIAIEPGDTLYTISLEDAKYKITQEELIRRYKEKDFTLREYFIEYYKCYNEICELLKKIL